MIPNITKGDRMAGLIVYLAGPGRHNEHTDQHVVGGDEATMWRFADQDLDKPGAYRIARWLDDPRRANPDTRCPDGHVWHCSLSISPRDGLLGDDEWQRIAAEFMAAMGFDDADGTKSPVHWVAIRHGLSVNGNDHIHIAANIIREDGTKVDTFRDWPRSQAACRRIEREHGLEEVGCELTESATRGYRPGEREAQASRRAAAQYEREHPGQAWNELDAQERGRLTGLMMEADQPRWTLATKVRAAAAKARDEAQFVRLMRADGLIVRPRYAQGGTGVITGYSVAERPRYGEAPTWYGGGTLARDLTLPRLRETWPDTADGAQQAADEWHAALKNRRVAHPMPGERPADPTRVAGEIKALAARLRAVDPNDRDTWSQVARETAGTLASWSRAVEPEPGPLAEAARQISRSAQTYRPPARRDDTIRIATGSAALAFASLATLGRNPMGEAIMMRQLYRVITAIMRAAEARGDAFHARKLAETHDRQLREVMTRLPAAPDVEPASGTTAGVPGTGRRTPERTPDPSAATPEASVEGDVEAIRLALRWMPPAERGLDAAPAPRRLYPPATWTIRQQESLER